MLKTPLEQLSDLSLSQGLSAAPQVSRRGFLAAAAGAVLVPKAFAGTPATQASLAVDPLFWSKPRQLWLRRLASSEEVRVVYWRDGKVDTKGYIQACEILRDVQEASAVQMDPMLLNVLAGVQAYYKAYGRNEPIYVNSGYRTLAHNRQLQSEGAARNSMHLYGKAADITMPGIPVWHLGRVREYLQAGGVGFYPNKHFVHVDTGTSRSWNG